MTERNAVTGTGTANLGELGTESPNDMITVSRREFTEFQAYMNSLRDCVRRGGNLSEIPSLANDQTYMEQILATPMTYHPHIVEALQDFKRLHKIGNESNEDRLAGMRILLAEIASAQNMTPPLLDMQDIDGSDSGNSAYDVSERKITMRGKLSIITFLHEIAHAVFSYDEHMSRVWSIKLFKQVYPRAFSRLVVTDGFVLRMPDSRITIPVRASGPA